MLSAAAEKPIYIIVDALDECPDLSGMPTPREDVLNLLESLVRMGLRNLRICVTSRPEVDIQNVLGPLAGVSISLHDEYGQKKDIFDYVTMSFTRTRRCEDGGVIRRIWLLRSFRRRRTECEGISLSLVVGSLIFYDTGSDGYSVNWRCCGTVSQRVFDELLTSYPNHWTTPTCARLAKSPRRTKITRIACCSASW
jgi:hypothetical protein